MTKITTAAMPLLSAHQLTCIREDRILFDELSFELYAGDILQVEGVNGAGKTSLLRLLAGLSLPYSGHTCYLGQQIQHCRDEYHAALLYLGHSAGVKNALTAEENLDFNLKIMGYSNFNSAAILKHVNLDGFEDSPAGHLSAGQHRRTALAKLWHTDSKIWILDEPFTAIDKTGVQALEALLLEHANNGGCVILTTHQDMNLITGAMLRKIRLEYHGI